MPKKIPAEKPALVGQAALDLVELSTQPFQELIRQLEMVCPGAGFAPGTTLTRVLLDPKVAKGYNVRVPVRAKDFPADVRAWCLSLGHMNGPKRQFYGYELQDAVAAAVEALLVGSKS